MGILLDPCHDDRINLVVDCPLNPLVCIRLGNPHSGYAVKRMAFDDVAHTIRAKITRQEHKRPSGQVDVAQTWVMLFE